MWALKMLVNNYSRACVCTRVGMYVYVYVYVNILVGWFCSKAGYTVYLVLTPFEVH